MEKILQLTPKEYWAYLQKYWFQVTVFGILCFIFLKRDFSFQINLNTPSIEQQEYRKQVVKQPRRLEMTERQVAKTTTVQSGILQGLRAEQEREVPVAETVSYQNTGEIDDWAIKSYIKRFKHVAIKEQEKYQIPASIIMANALFHSFAGQNELATNGNNHFGLKCSSEWTGSSQKIHRTCYRKYNTAWESFRDHSLYLQKGKFATLRKYDITDYQSWAKGLERLKYADQLKMGEQLISIIERYKLYQLDLTGI